MKTQQNTRLYHALVTCGLNPTQGVGQLKTRQRDEK